MQLPQKHRSEAAWATHQGIIGVGVGEQRADGQQHLQGQQWVVSA